MPNPPQQGQQGQQQAPQSQGPPWLQMIGRHLPQLLHYARSGRNPDVVADFVAEQLPAESLGMIYQTLTGAGFLDEFVRHVPDAREHMEWFGAFFNRVLEWIEPPGTGSESDEEGAAGAAGAAPDPPDGKPEVGTVARGGGAATGDGGDVAPGEGGE